MRSEVAGKVRVRMRVRERRQVQGSLCCCCRAVRLALRMRIVRRARPCACTRIAVAPAHTAVLLDVVVMCVRVGIREHIKLREWGQIEPAMPLSVGRRRRMLVRVCMRVP